MNKNNIISDWLDKYGEPEIDKKVEIKLEKMNNERYNQIIDEVYNKYLTRYMGYEDVPSKELFLFEVRTNDEFSEKWGLKIEEKELSLEERIDYWLSKDDFRFTDAIINEEDYESFGFPTKLITLTYNNETIEIYE